MRASRNFFIDEPVWPSAYGDGADGGGTPDRLEVLDDNGLPPAPPEEEEPEYMEPRPLKSRRLEIARLGEPPERASCFGCVYFGENETILPSEELRHLVEMSRQSIGRVDMLTLAEAMEDYYERHIRAPINARLRAGERPLPRWPASQILEHIRHHNQDPLVQQVVLLAETQELRTDLLERCFEVSSKTGKTRPNKNNIDCYEKIVKLQLHIQKQDASKMAFYSAGARVNPEILAQGVMSTHTKKLHSFWKIK